MHWAEPKPRNLLLWGDSAHPRRVTSCFVSEVMGTKPWSKQKQNWFMLSTFKLEKPQLLLRNIMLQPVPMVKNQCWCFETNFVWHNQFYSVSFSYWQRRRQLSAAAELVFCQALFRLAFLPSKAACWFCLSSDPLAEQHREIFWTTKICSHSEDVFQGRAMRGGLRGI